MIPNIAHKYFSEFILNAYELNSSIINIIKYKVELVNV